jgi:hypothetical protein
MYKRILNNQQLQFRIRVQDVFGEYSASYSTSSVITRYDLTGVSYCMSGEQGSFINNDSDMYTFKVDYKTIRYTDNTIVTAEVSVDSKNENNVGIYVMIKQTVNGENNYTDSWSTVHKGSNNGICKLMADYNHSTDTECELYVEVLTKDDGKVYTIEETVLLIPLGSITPLTSSWGKWITCQIYHCKNGEWIEQDVSAGINGSWIEAETTD